MSGQYRTDSAEQSVFNVIGPISDDRAGLGAGVHHFAVHHGVIHPQAEEMTLLLLRMFVSNLTSTALSRPAGCSGIRRV